MFTYLDDTVEIIGSERPPFSDDRTILPYFDEMLIKGGIFPWFWDLKSMKFFIHNSILDKITTPETVFTTLNRFFALNIFKDDQEKLLKSLFHSYRIKTFHPVNFRMFINSRESLHWFRMEGAFNFEEDRLVSTVGYLVNITQYRKLHQRLSDSTDYFKTITDMIPLPIFYKDRNLIYRYHNKAFNEAMNLPPEKINGKTVYDLEPGSLSEIFNQADRELLENSSLQVYESTVRYGDGSFRDIVFRKNVIYTETGEVEGIAGIMTDVTETRRMEVKMARMVMMKDISLKTNQAILEGSSLNTILNLVMEQIRKIVTRADCGSILLLDEDNILNLEVSFGYRKEEAENFSLPFRESFLWNTGISPGEEPVIIPDLSKLEKIDKYPPMPETEERIPVQSILSIPICSKDRVLGILSLDSYKKNIFNEDDLEMMRYLKEHLLVLLDNQQAFQRLLQ